MSRWKSIVIKRVHDLARRGRVLVTRKAVQELENLEVSLQASDLPGLLLGLQATSLKERLRSAVNEQWLYVFNLDVEGVGVYLKIGLLDDCVVISLHEWD